MKKTDLLDPIYRYIKEIDVLLPYPDDKKIFVLKQLKTDVQDAMGSDKRPPSVVFGSPKEVAINLSLAQDWGIIKASWKLRIFAFFIDFFILSSLLLIFVIIPIFYLFQDPINTVDKKILFLGLNILVGIPTLIFIISYFTILEKIYSSTIGKKIFGLKVVDETGIRLTWSQALIRNITKVPFTGQFLVFDVLIGIYSEKTRKNKQRVLDLVAGTIVVKQT